jgi:hypothetical protein
MSGSTYEGKHADSVTAGKHIVVHQLNDFFNHLTEMMLEHFDTPEWNDVVFVLGCYMWYPYEVYRQNFPGKRIIVYQTEQLFGTHGRNNFVDVPSIVESLRGYPEVWDYDELNVHFLSYFDVVVKKVLPPLYTKSLRRIETVPEPSIDVLFYGTMNPRRANLIDAIQRKFYAKNTFVWSYCKIQDIDRYIADAKVVLNLHAFEPWNRQEQVRMFYPVINGKTVVSEPSQENRMQGLIIEVKPEELGQRLLEICTTDTWRTFGAAAATEFERRTREFVARGGTRC